MQGYGIDELAQMPQIISGSSPEAAEEAAALFRNIAPEIVTLDPIEAEFAKLFGNAYRYIEFAVTNQFYLIARSAGLDYHRILRSDEAQLSPCQKHSDARIRRGSMPDEGHDAAGGICTKRIQPRQRCDA